MSRFRKYDHIIWDADTDPEVCVLGNKMGTGFKDVKYGEYIDESQLESARKATGKEILDYYKSLGADI